MLKLKIGRKKAVAIESLEEARSVYIKARDDSGEGASTFPDGKVTGGFKISYNGRVWEDSAIGVVEVKV